MSGADVTLREITRETLKDILKLKVADGQERFVATNAVSIAQAHFYPDVAWFRGIYAGDAPVGFVMLELHPDKQEYGLWRFMIDAGHQGNGYGRAAIGQVIDFVRTLPGATQLLTSVVPGEGSPGPFYESLGFAYTGDIDEGERVLRLAL